MVFFLLINFTQNKKSEFSPEGADFSGIHGAPTKRELAASREGTFRVGDGAERRKALFILKEKTKIFGFGLAQDRR